MIATIICLNGRKELELVAARRIGYSQTQKRFWFEMMGCSDVFYYDGIEADVASNTIKAALAQNSVSLTDFGSYEVEREVLRADSTSQNCPKQEYVKAEPKAAMAADRNSVAGEAPAKPSLSDRVSQALGKGTKKVRGFVQAVAVVAAEEKIKDNARSAARKAEREAKRAKLESEIRERRARRKVERYSDEDDIRSEFEEIVAGVTVAADATVCDTIVEKPAAVEIGAEVAEALTDSNPISDSGDVLKEITQLHLDFDDVDGADEDIT